MALRLLKLPDVCDRRGLKPSSVYAAVKDGTMTPPIKLTSRSSAWPEHEIDRINAAFIAGHAEEQIRDLVRQLIAERPNLPGRLTPAAATANAA